MVILHYFLMTMEGCICLLASQIVTPISVVELDPVTFKEKGSKVDVVFAQASIHGWERRGDDNLLDEQPWIEGSWMIKSNNKYYLHYAGPGTEFKTYADGIYVADSPLGPYEYAPYSPFSFKPTGFITGAGHGCTFKDKNGKYWHIGTMTISVRHMFERRLGISPVAFDEDGHIHCNTDWGDYPQYFPGVKDDPVDSSFAGMMLLSHKKYVWLLLHWKIMALRMPLTKMSALIGVLKPGDRMNGS